MHLASYGGRPALRLNDDASLSLKDYFGSGGDGADLTVWVQTAGQTVSFPAAGVQSAGGNYVNFNLSSGASDLIGGINSGDRFILAMTRPEPTDDATLSDLTLSGVTLSPAFASATTGYTADVGNGVTQTTVSPTTNDDGATYAIKLGGVTDADGTVSLSVGENAITVEVTAEDDSTVKTYTVTVTRAGPPLTASFQNAPESHNGTDSFTFELRFSEEFAISYRTLRDHAFTVTGGSVTQARRLVQGSDLRWEVTGAPDSTADVVIVLPATEDCAAQGAICAGDDRGLSNRLELTVSGPEPSTPPPSTDATLSGLSLSGVTLSPAFATGTYTYTADVGSDVTQTTVTPTTNDDGATYAIQAGRRGRRRRDRLAGRGRERHRRGGDRRGRQHGQDLRRHRDPRRAALHRRQAGRLGPERHHAVPDFRLDHLRLHR